MTALRIALAQVDPTVGDLTGNARLIRDWVARAAEVGADLVAFPEMCLTGYPIEDLALRGSFQRAVAEALPALARAIVADGHADITVVVGFLGTSDTADARLGQPAGAPMNAAAVVRGGEIIARYAKHHLPNYGVFDEFRYFVPGDSPTYFEVGGAKVALAICEDLWQEGGPVAEIAGSGCDLLLVINGSPYELSKTDERLDLCVRRAAEVGMTLAYVNQVGGQDELVFDGDSLVVAKDGRLLARAAAFAEDLLVLDLGPDETVGPIAPPMAPAESVYSALVLGLRDYVEKNGFASVLLGLSGGIDSALVAAIACDALGPDRVFGVSMPSRFSSDHSRSDATDLAERTGLNLRQVAIAPMVDAYEANLELTGLAAENLQARVRGTTLMAISNQEGHLVLATGNKSELAVGYSTIYGDAVGGYAPIKDVPKTLVWELANWRNDRARQTGATPPIPENSISKPPSAELRPDQLDSDSLPDYAELDAVLAAYVAGDRGAADLVAAGFDRDLVLRVMRLTDAAEYKRRQYPPGPKVSFKAFGRDRRLPITNAWRETT